jgi:hypothetical protein
MALKDVPLIKKLGNDVRAGRSTWKKATAQYNKRTKDNISREKFIGRYRYLMGEIKSGGQRAREKRETPDKKAQKNIPEMIEYEALVDSLREQAQKDAAIIQTPPKQELFSGRREESAVLMVSDAHVGKRNYFLDMETGESIETYNKDIMLKEFNRLLDGISTVNAILANSYTLRKLYIFGLGDILDNDIIVKGQKWFVDVGVGGQLMLAVEAFTKLINELLMTFEEIEFVVIGGNHGRMTPRREKAPFYNNFDWIMGQVLKIQFQNEPRVTITTPESWFYLQKIYGWRYLLHHGNSVYSWMGLPYYGLQRSGKARRTEVAIDVECIGHFHQRMEIPINSKSYTLVNGSWIDRDDFGWEKYGVFSKPEQIYFGVSPKRPRTWSFNLDLRVD